MRISVLRFVECQGGFGTFNFEIVKNCFSESFCSQREKPVFRRHLLHWQLNHYFPTQRRCDMISLKTIKGSKSYTNPEMVGVSLHLTDVHGMDKCKAELQSRSVKLKPESCRYLEDKTQFVPLQLVDGGCFSCVNH